MRDWSIGKSVDLLIIYLFEFCVRSTMMLGEEANLLQVLRHIDSKFTGNFKVNAIAIAEHDATGAKLFYLNFEGIDIEEESIHVRPKDLTW